MFQIWTFKGKFLKDHFFVRFFYFNKKYIENAIQEYFIL